tara:strand:- start:47886 stop:48338 length:453 start_codon:yes stop_codon:yes gene_type:complete
MRSPLLIAFLFLMALSMAVVLAVPNFKKKFKEYFVTEHRTILGKVVGNLHPGSETFVILKIKQKENIFVEVYKEDPKTETLQFMQKLDLGQKKEGHFTFKNEATNLVFTNIDDDENLEILVPVFDSEMTARLYTIKYNESIMQFEVLNSN